MTGYCITIMVTRVLFFSICIFLNFFFSLSLQANDAFDEFKKAILNEATKIEIQGLCQEYKQKRLDGWAYIVSIGNDVEGNVVINLSTKKDPLSPDSISIVVFLRKFFIGKKLRVKVGHRVRFIGNFEEIRMSTIVLNQGVVKY